MGKKIVSLMMVMTLMMGQEVRVQAKGKVNVYVCTKAKAILYDEDEKPVTEETSFSYRKDGQLKSAKAQYSHKTLHYKNNKLTGIKETKGDPYYAKVKLNKAKQIVEAKIKEDDNSQQVTLSYNKEGLLSKERNVYKSGENQLGSIDNVNYVYDDDNQMSQIIGHQSYAYGSENGEEEYYDLLDTKISKNKKQTKVLHYNDEEKISLTTYTYKKIKVASSLVKAISSQQGYMIYRYDHNWGYK